MNALEARKICNEVNKPRIDEAKEAVKRCAPLLMDAIEHAAQSGDQSVIHALPTEPKLGHYQNLGGEYP